MANNIQSKKEELNKELVSLNEEFKKLQNSIKIIQTRAFQVKAQLDLISEQENWEKKPAKKK